MRLMIDDKDSFSFGPAHCRQLPGTQVKAVHARHSSRDFPRRFP
jgi:hypothetical protein